MRFPKDDWSRYYGNKWIWLLSAILISFRLINYSPTCFIMTSFKLSNMSSVFSIQMAMCLSCTPILKTLLEVDKMLNYSSISLWITSISINIMAWIIWSTPYVCTSLAWQWSWSLSNEVTKSNWCTCILTMLY